MKLFEKLTLGISGALIIISVIGFFRDCSQDNRINKLQYELNANNYKPIIQVDSVTLTDIYETLRPINIQKNIEDTSSTIDVKSNFKTKITFHLENIGNSNAKIVASILIDTISGNEKIRETMFNKNIPFKIDTSGIDFYEKLQIQQQKKKDIIFSHEVNFFVNNTFTMHLLIIYYNDMGMLYDTYYWVRFKKKDLNFTAIVDTWNNNIVGLKIEKNDLNNYLQRIDDNNTYKIYSLKEKKKIEKLLEQLKHNAR